MKKVWLIIQDEVDEEFDEIVGNEVVGVYKTQEAAKAQARAMRFWSLKNNAPGYNNIRVEEFPVEDVPSRRIGEPFKCMVHIQVDFSKSYKTFNVWRRTMPFYDDYDGGTWTHGCRAFVIEMPGVYDGLQEEAKVNFEEVMKRIDKAESEWNHEYWEMVRDAIVKHHKEFPGMYI